MGCDEVFVERQSEAGLVSHVDLAIHDLKWGIVEVRPELIRFGVRSGGEHQPVGYGCSQHASCSQNATFPDEAVIQLLYIHQFRDVFIFILLNQHANDLYQRGQGTIIILAYLVDQIIQNSHKLLIFALRVRNENNR